MQNDARESLPQERRLERMSGETPVFLHSFLDWVWQGTERTSPEERGTRRDTVSFFSSNGLGWSGWAVRGSVWRGTDTSCKKGCRCADPMLFL